MKLERRKSLSVDEFTRDFLVENKPVIVTDAMDSWRAMDVWTPAYLERKFGAEKVQVYGDLFMLLKIMTLSEYLGSYLSQNDDVDTSKGKLYVRWYTRFNKKSHAPWADHVFHKLKDDWSMPYFLPVSSYLLPWCPPTQAINANDTPFPARGLFISPRGARTRLHADPWASDAVLCQLSGQKKFIMYPPDQAAYLVNGEKFVDIEKPDLGTFPRFPKAHATVDDLLNPGEVVFVPAGWFHHFRTISDSISLTWNFVHMTRWKAFFKYLRARPPEDEVETIEYFLFDIEERLRQT